MQEIDLTSQGNDRQKQNVGMRCALKANPEGTGERPRTYRVEEPLTFRVKQ